MRTLAYAERLLWIVGLFCVGTCLLLRVQAREYPHFTHPVGQPATRADNRASGDVIGRIEIPALALSAPILKDFTAKSLRRGVGHISGTAMPGGLGTVGLAGHRDSFFRPLRGISTKMDIQLTDHSGTYHYSVDSTEIVDPDKVQVLEIAARPELTLITCFPFDFVGAAPRRFIVHAHLLSVAPETLPPVR